MKFRLISAAVVSFILGVLYACQNENELNFKRYYTAGRAVYQDHCQNCHGDKGEGLNALIPPLTDSVFLKGNRRQLPCIIKNGASGSINVNNKPFNQQMPAQTGLSPIEIAQVITYVNNSFGNKLGLIEVQEAELNLAACR